MMGASLVFSLLANFASAAAPREIRVLAFNTWQLKAFGLELAEDRLDRLKLIPDMIAGTGADIIALSEVWKNSTKKLLAKELAERGYPYSFYTLRKAGMGDGLLILSKHPIGESEKSKVFHPKTMTDELITSKRAYHVVVQVSGVGPVDFFSTHLGAVEFDEKKDAYNEHQQDELATQMLEFATFIKDNRTSPYAIAAGDLNAHYQVYSAKGRFEPVYSKPYSAMIAGACSAGTLINTYLAVHGMDEKSPAVPTYSQENPYVGGGYFSEIPSEVEDYIFQCPSATLRPVRSERMFVDAIPDSAREAYGLKKLPKRLSDHFGMMTTFSFSEVEADRH